MKIAENDSEILSQNGIPLYHQLKEIFSEKIASGEWEVGEVIPNELLLTRYYGVSRGPARQALVPVPRGPGSPASRARAATKVLPPKIESDLGGFYSFTTLIQNRGMHAKRPDCSLSTPFQQKAVWPTPLAYPPVHRVSNFAGCGSPIKSR